MSAYTVRECPVHGLVDIRVRDDGRCPAMWCRQSLSGRFKVIRPTLARSSDPPTSRTAALRFEPRAGSQRGRILVAVDRFGPMTARQIGSITGIPGAWKRISELVQGGQLAVLTERIDRETQQKVNVYTLTR